MSITGCSNAGIFRKAPLKLGDPGDTVTFTYTTSSSKKISTTYGSNTLADDGGKLSISCTTAKLSGSGVIQNTYNTTFGGQQMTTNANNGTTVSFTFGNPWSGTHATYKDYTQINSVTFTAVAGSSTTYNVACTIDGVAATGDHSSFDATKTTCTFTPAEDHDRGVIVITVSYSSGSKGWYFDNLGINAEVPTGGQQGPTALTNPSPQYDDSNKTVSWTTDAHATKYQIKVDDAADYSDINTETYDASSLTTGQQHTVYIKAVGDGENYSSSEGSVTFTPTAPFVSKNYVLCTSTTDLEAGANYIVTSGISGTVKTMSIADTSDYRPLTDVTVSDSKIASTQTTLTVALGGLSGAWTFHTNNYLGTAGYLASGTGTNNHLRVIASADNCTISFNGNAAVITFSSNASRNVLRYNSTNTRFACYAANNSMADVYLWREYTSKTVSSLNVTGIPTKLSGYFDSDTFDPSGITAYQAVYSDESTKTVPASDIVWPALVANMGTIRGSYTERGTTVYTPSYDISVSADSLSIVLSGTMVTSYYTTDTEWDKGNLVATAQYASGNSFVVTASATFTYYSNESMTSEVASPAALGAGENQTIYVKATYETVSNTVGYAQTVSVTVEHGTVIDDPLTAGQAFAIGSALSSGSSTTKLYYVTGVVSEIVSNELDSENNRATFWLQNGETAHGFEAFNIHPDSGCTNYTDLKVGAEVLIYCTIKKYSNSVIENGSTASLLNITYTAPTLTDIVLNKSELLLGVGEEVTLTVSPTPVGAELGEITWTSSNGSAASVNSNGKVTAVAVGTTTITVSAGGFSKTCSVSVFEKAVLQFTGNSSVYANTLTSEELTEALNLDTNTFEVTYDKNGATNEMYLVKDEGVRMYATKNTTNGNKFTVTSPSHIIERIIITFTGGASVAEVSTGSNVIDGTNGAYIIGADEFTLFDNNSSVNSNTQVKFSKIEIFYRDKNATETVESSLTQTKLAYHYQKDENDQFYFSNISIRFGGLISKALWDELDTNEHVISGFGVMIASGEALNANEYIKDNLDAAVLADVEPAPSIENADIVDYYMPKAEMATPVEQGDNYFWNLFQRVDSDKITDVFVAVAYIKIGDEYVFMKQVRYSVKSLANDYLENRGCDDTTADGSLANLAA